jgi:hypothetical protein
MLTMNISKDDAAKALSEIATTQGRSYTLTGYRIAGPILIVWGVIWILCYAAMGVLHPSQWNYVWIPADLSGIVATLMLSRAGKAQDGAKSGTKTGWRVFGYVVLVGVFCSAIFSMFRPSDPHVYMAFPGLATGMIYAAIGIWRMTRYIWVGAIVIAASLIGFFYFPSILAFWMAVTGGGGLIVTGLLFRRA